MNYKIYIYIFSVLLSVFSLTSINFEKFIRKNRVIETRILVILLGMALGYLVTNFIVDFLSSTQIL